MLWSLVSGKYAMIQMSGLGFALVPWRPVIEHELGRNISGIMHDDNISWELGRSRDLGIRLRADKPIRFDIEETLPLACRKACRPSLIAVQRFAGSPLSEALMIRENIPEPSMQNTEARTATLYLILQSIFLLLQRSTCTIKEACKASGHGADQV